MGDVLEMDRCAPTVPKTGKPSPVNSQEPKI